jgi:hypothetical protein
MSHSNFISETIRSVEPHVGLMIKFLSPFCILMDLSLRVWPISSVYYCLLRKYMHILLIHNKRQYCFYTYLHTDGTEQLLRSRHIFSHSRTSHHFIEPEGSLQCSQESSTGPYPEPDQSYPSQPILYL